MSNTLFYIFVELSVDGFLGGGGGFGCVLLRDLLGECELCDPTDIPLERLLLL